MLTNIEKKILASIQDDIPVTEQPFLEISERLGISENTFLDILQDLCNRGVIRRFGATLRHRESGFAANAMVAWLVEEKRIDDVGKRMSLCKQVTHCYRRNPTDDWPYNLYTMIHAIDEKICREKAREMSKECAVDTYKLLFSRRELKKTSMKYFPDFSCEK